MKNFLFILRSAPYANNATQEQLDVILTTAAFEQRVALLFLDNGVFQLKKNQNTQTQGLKNTGLIFKALEVYDVTELYVENESLQNRGLSQLDLSLPSKIVCRKDINGLIKKFEVVFSACA